MSAPERVERVAADGTVACADGSCAAGGRAVLWALDLRDGDPVGAHQVVSSDADRAITACGQIRTRISHPRGWWSCHPGDDPLQEHAIHCRAAAGSAR